MALPDSRNDRDYRSWEEDPLAPTQTRRKVTALVDESQLPLPVTLARYEAVVGFVQKSRFIDQAVYDRMVLASNVDATQFTFTYYQDGYVLGQAVVNLTSNLAWDFNLNHYLNADDGSALTADDDTTLLLE